MIWEEVKTIIDVLRQKDSVRIEFCYVPHGDAVFIHAGYPGTTLNDKIIGMGSGEQAFEDALSNARKWLDQ